MTGHNHTVVFSSFTETDGIQRNAGRRAEKHPLDSWASAGFSGIDERALAK
jgi:hypothetical protein